MADDASVISELDQAIPASNGPAGEGDDELRTIKRVLLASFSALDGLINNTGATNEIGDKDPPDAATFSNLFSDVRTLKASTAAVPVGAIVMWAGSVASIPDGWALCNGDNTPDLRDRFILGTDDANSQYNIGQMGGSVWSVENFVPSMTTAPSGGGTGTGTLRLPPHDITPDNLPEHTHAMFTADTPSNSGNPPVVGQNENVAGSALNPNGSQAYAMVQGPSDPPTQGITGKYGTAAGSKQGLEHPDTEINITGIVHDHAFLPAFYALAFIQYKGA